MDPEIATLLKLKKDLASLLEKNSAPANEQSNDVAQNIQNLEEQILKQGEKVRHLKATADRTIWQPEVDALLKLKKELSSLSGNSTVQPTSSKSNKKK